MGVVVQKYGGSSVADVARIKRVADRVAAAKAAGKDVVVVVSAMGDTTDELLQLARQVTDSPARRELDMLLTAGERISMALLSMALNARNVPAVSFTGSQSGIITNDAHTNARIVEVRPFRVQDELERGKVVIVAGYQGVSYKREVTTLGRGGSDTTAVALAAALDAEACEIYSDVEGVYSADPRVVPEAARLAELSYEEMQELAEAGAKVLNAQAVEFAKERGIVIYARSTHGGPGETVVRKSPPRAPGRVVGIASEKGLVILTSRAGRAGGLSGLLEILDKRQVGGKQLHFEEWAGQGGSATIVLSLENIHAFAELRRELSETFANELMLREGVGAVSAIGAGINVTFTNLRRFLAALAGMGAPLVGLSTSSFRISALVEEARVEEAVRRLHAELVATAEPTTPGV
jgi:aspartate kinase